MIEQEKLQEVEQLGGMEVPPAVHPTRFGFAGYLVAQAVLCALILVALAIVKLCDSSLYSQVSSWYYTEIQREIELPHWESPTESTLVVT